MQTRLLPIMFVLAVSLIFSLTHIPSAVAAEAGGYFGASIGETDAGLGVSDFNDGSIISGDVDDSDTGWKLFGGYRFNENVALEGGLYNLGEVTFNGTSNGAGFLFAAGPVSADVEADGFFAAVVGTIPFNKFSVFGQIGFHSWDADVKLTDSSGSFSGDDDGTDPLYGVGVAYHPNDRVTIRGALEVFTEILEEDIELLSISVLINPK